MTDTPDTQETTEETPDTPEPEPEKDDGRLPDDHPVVKALRKANKEAEEYRRKVKEFEDASKSEQERAAEKAAEAEQRAAQAEAELARHRAAIKHGLTAQHLELLDGIPAEQVEARAKRLAELVNTPSAPPASRNQGGPSDAPDIDPEKFAESLWTSNRI